MAIPWKMLVRMQRSIINETTPWEKLMILGDLRARSVAGKDVGVMGSGEEDIREVGVLGRALFGGFGER